MTKKKTAVKEEAKPKKSQSPRLPKGPSPKQPQGELLSVPEEKAPAVVNERILTHYVKPRFSKTKAGDRTIGLEFSFWLTDEHEELIPKVVREGRKFMARKGMKRLDLIDVPPQFAKFWLTSDDKEEALTLPAARVTHVSLSVIEQKGAGQAQKIIRLSFRLEVKMTADVGRFAEWNYGEALWLFMGDTQETLWDEEEDGNS